MIVGFLATSFAIFGIDPLTKPGGLLLGGVLCLALTHWVGQVMRSGSHAIVDSSHDSRRWTVFGVFGQLCRGGQDRRCRVCRVTRSPELLWLVAALVLAGFGGMFSLHAALASDRGARVLKRWHIHASNGFYVESILRRVFGPLVNS